MLNKVQLIGRIGQDIELRYTPSGVAVADISLATSKKIKGEEKTEWHKLVIWKQTAEFAKNYLGKGSLVYAEGEITYRKWQDKEGNNRYSTEIQVYKLLSLSKSTQAGTQTGTPVVTDDNDEIPF